MKVAIIGGGAAGFFAAISAKTNHPDAEVIIFEKSAKTLAKVKISGGGRCNVTNATYKIGDLVKHYPRGEKHLRKTFSQFMTSDTIEWFESRGVPLVTQEDLCIFPKAQDSQVIIDTLMTEVDRLGILVRIQSPIQSIDRLTEGFNLHIKDNPTYICDKLIVCTGGQPKMTGLQWLADHMKSLGQCLHYLHLICLKIL